MQKTIAIVVMLLASIFMVAQSAPAPPSMGGNTKAQAPTKFTASAHGIGLSWTPSTTAGVNKQLLCRSTTTGTENCSAPLATFNDNTTNSYSDSSGTAGQQYFYVLEACIGTVCSSPSTEANAVFPTVPASPTSLSATPF